MINQILMYKILNCLEFRIYDLIEHYNLNIRIFISTASSSARTDKNQNRDLEILSAKLFV